MLSARTVGTLVAIAATSVSLSALPGSSARARHNATREAIAPAEIQQQLRSFRMMATVLHVGAHPDDENTQLITALSRGRAVRTAYLSVTRGDGGQNLLGPEFGYKLGIARTQELLAARRIDGGRQFFTRALDFGFSKDYLETFNVWGRDSILSDVVRVVRSFRPDVIVTVFSTQPGGTHGHHTGSAVLALEAFKLATDSNAFPDQLKTLGVWQPRRIFSGSGPGGRGAVVTTGPRMEVGGVDPVLGESFASLASRSRAMHKTQGFGQTPAPGATTGGRGTPGATSRMQGFTLLAGDPVTADIFEGIDTTWARIPGGADVDRMTADVMQAFDANDPSKSIPGLLGIRRVIAGLDSDPLVTEKRALLDQIILECAGVTAEALVPNPEAVPGETLHVRSIMTVASSVPVIRRGQAYPSGQRIMRSVTLVPNQPDTAQARDVLPAATPLTQPYWLRNDATAGMFRVDDPSLIGLPENPPGYQVAEVLEIGGETFVVRTEPVAITKDSLRGESRRRLAVIPPVSLGFSTDVGVFRPGSTKEVAVEVVANRATPRARVSLDAPAGWSVVPASRSVTLKTGGRATYKFTVTAPRTASTTNIGAHITIGDRRWNTQRSAVDYAHIPYQLLQPAARFKAVSADIATRGRNIGYIPGAGDDIPQALEQLGYKVTQIPAASITTAALRRFDAVVIGVRAANVGPEIGAAMPALTAYAEGGGVVIEQYSQNGNNLRTTTLGPYPLTIANERVTNENAEVTFLAPDHPVLNSPNKITASDFEGWVQERGIYFAGQWDARYTPILAMNDAGEAPLKGSLLVARVGKGYFVYTGLVFFRELPAGVPGAYRLFANIVSLGKTAQAIVP